MQNKKKKQTPEKNRDSTTSSNTWRNSKFYLATIFIAGSFFGGFFTKVAEKTIDKVWPSPEVTDYEEINRPQLFSELLIRVQDCEDANIWCTKGRKAYRFSYELENKGVYPAKNLKFRCSAPGILIQYAPNEAQPFLAFTRNKDLFPAGYPNKEKMDQMAKERYEKMKVIYGNTKEIYSNEIEIGPGAKYVFEGLLEAIDVRDEPLSEFVINIYYNTTINGDIKNYLDIYRYIVAKGDFYDGNRFTFRSSARRNAQYDPSIQDIERP